MLGRLKYIPANIFSFFIYIVTESFYKNHIMTVRLLLKLLLYWSSGGSSHVCSTYTLAAVSVYKWKKVTPGLYSLVDMHTDGCRHHRCLVFLPNFWSTKPLEYTMRTHPKYMSHVILQQVLQQTSLTNQQTS